MLKVSDQGGGIAESIRDTLFEPFVTTKTGGSGLGLSIAHRAVEAHHGFILVESDRDGTRFTVILPKMAGEPSRRTPKARAKVEA